MKIGGIFDDSYGGKNFRIYEVKSVEFSHVGTPGLYFGIDEETSIGISPIEYEDGIKVINALKMGDYAEVDSKYLLQLDKHPVRPKEVIANIKQDEPIDVSIAATGDKYNGYITVSDKLPVKIIEE